MSDSSAFQLLDERIQQFLWAEGWESLRDAQEAAIPPILAARSDVIVAAATAAGKTEAAFLPALTHLMQQPSGGLIVYISPLKALINDQFGRLDRLCERLDVPVWPWHGDIASSKKTRFIKQPQGVLLITPESLEAFLCNRGTAVAGVFSGLTFFVIDELHAFIGSERGKQLQALLHRIETVVARPVARIGLSATLGEMSLAKEFLRPGQGAEVEVVESATAAHELRVLVKGYEFSGSVEQCPEAEHATSDPIAAHLFKVLRGSNNLIFPNSRQQVECYTYLLNSLCQAAGVPNEFWPHHGNLARDIRAETEAALKQKEWPATAVCTNTLELGIDIGAVRSVAQIGPPPSVASLRQRLGRSGRRKGEPAILRGYCKEVKLHHSSPRLIDEWRLPTLQMVAMISLLIEGWFEPPRVSGMHLSTLVQQVLAFIAQNGGASIGQLYGQLCSGNAPFNTVSRSDFIELVRHLGAKELLMQDSSGLLLHGRIGEALVNHYSFYAAFSVPEEFRLVAAGRTLGTLPVTQLLRPEQRILFAGKTWLVEEVDEERKTIFVRFAGGGMPPLFDGGSGWIHTRVRQRMHELLVSAEVPPYLDAGARGLLLEARKNYAAKQLAGKWLLAQGDRTLLLTWLGDASNTAIACLLTALGAAATACELGVEVLHRDQQIDVVGLLARLAASPLPSVDTLLEGAQNLIQEKWDWALPDGLLKKSYASLYLDLDEAFAWICSRG